MNRLVFIVALLFIGLFFTQCGDDCGDYNFTPRTTTGISDIQTETQPIWGVEPVAGIDSFGIFMRVDFSFAQQTPKWSFVTSAYACSTPPTPFYDATQYIDSIVVFSEPNYGSSSAITSLLKFEQTTDLTSFNSFIDRRILNGEGSGYFFFKEKPTQSDSFTFSFYYYKDGAIIDSSSTQKYFISNE